MRSETAPAIRLEDYQSPAYRIDTVHLNVDLHPTATSVTATLLVRRQADTDAGTPLLLDGDELTLKGILVNGEPLTPEGYRAATDSLEIFDPPAGPFELTLVTEIDPSANTKLMGLYRSGKIAPGFRATLLALPGGPEAFPQNLSTPALFMIDGHTQFDHRV